MGNKLDIHLLRSAIAPERGSTPELTCAVGRTEQRRESRINNARRGLFYSLFPIPYSLFPIPYFLLFYPDGETATATGRPARAGFTSFSGQM